MSKLIDSISLVLDFNSSHGDKTLKCSSMIAKVATQQLEVVSKQLNSGLNLDLNKYALSISYGSGYFPKVPWVGITPKGKKVSNSISVCICFSKQGLGVVCGAMFPEVKADGKYVTLNRNVAGGEYINLFGGGVRTNYTNKFVNPKDFYKGMIEEKELLQHVESSLKLMDDYSV